MPPRSPYAALIKPGYFDDLASPARQGDPVARAILDFLLKMSPADLAARRDAADVAIRTMGITFTVYSEAGAIDRMWPFDIVPRIIELAEWRRIEQGLKQRVRALNHFIDDIYGEQQILKDGVFPAWVLEKSVNFRPECVGMQPPYGVWAHICGSDLVRGEDGTMYVLEDNLRVPSGVSYMLENRAVMKRTFPELFEHQDIQPVDEYPTQLYETLAALSPSGLSEPNIVVLTPGIYNSAYFEHSFLAREMGVPLVEGRDLIVEDDQVFMRTTRGKQRVDVIYRRIDDIYLDPVVFDMNSMLGVPGLMHAYRCGNVAIANAPGSGVADNKSIYPYVPDLIRFYLDEEIILPQVHTLSLIHI